jgi:hypothetical protein
MRESTIEAYLRDEVRKLGGRAIKITSQGSRGWPDRVVVFPGGCVEFIELKRPGGQPTPLQTKRWRQLVELGAWVETLYSKADVDRYLEQAKLRAGIGYEEDCW